MGTVRPPQLIHDTQTSAPTPSPPHNPIQAQCLCITSLPSSPLPSLSARPSTTPSLSPSSALSSATPTAALRPQTRRRNTSTRRKPRQPLPRWGSSLLGSAVQAYGVG